MTTHFIGNFAALRQRRAGVDNRFFGGMIDEKAARLHAGSDSSADRLR